MELEINVWAVVLAFVASMVVGAVWYAKPVFGTMWMKLVGLTDKKAQQGAGAAFAKMIPFAVVQAYLVAFATSVASAFYTDRSWMSIALLAALVLWVVQTAAFVTHDAFEQRDIKITLINSGNQLATLLAMGAVVGWLEP